MSIEFEQYFVCESTGVQPGKDCGATPQEILEPSVTWIGAIAISLAGLLPLVVLMFSVKYDYKR